MSWRETFATRFGPGIFLGMTFGDWLRILRQNGFAVDPPYWGRAAVTTLGSLQNSILRWYENARYERRILQTPIEPPLFILGVWRSGTTHLHKLFAQDDRFASPNYYQALYPHSFLCTEKSSAKFVGLVMPRKRPQDNMPMGVQEPQEDEIALCALTGFSFLLSQAWPRNANAYDRFLTLRAASQEELARWKAALTWFVRKLTFKYGRPLVLKSPAHMGRIRLLLELFPEARFVHIHRHPYAVLQSARHTVLKVTPWWTLQHPAFDNLEDRTIGQYREICDAFFEERDLIPKGHFHELGFEQLERDPLNALRQVYEALELPRFEHVEPALGRYLAGIADYKKNMFSELSPEFKAKVAKVCQRSFEAWHYSTGT
jgi:omega-hydroxy-beta-dihydromenaquinone-9 sulfotransferase